MWSLVRQAYERWKRTTQTKLIAFLFDLNATLIGLVLNVLHLCQSSILQHTGEHRTQGIIEVVMNENSVQNIIILLKQFLVRILFKSQNKSKRKWKKHLMKWKQKNSMKIDPILGWPLIYFMRQNNIIKWAFFKAQTRLVDLNLVPKLMREKKKFTSSLSGFVISTLKCR